MRLAIVAGGPEELIPRLGNSQYRDCRWIGADRGTFVLIQQNIIPFAAFGDFDSISETERAAIRNYSIDCHSYPREKDKTDLEIAIDWALEQHPDQLLVFGATGGRQDHALANIWLLLRASVTNTKMVLLDRKNSIRMLVPGIYHLKREPSRPYLSFLAFSEKVSGITLRGVKYPLTNAVLEMGSSLCISNEAVDDSMTVSFSSGFLLLMRCSD